MKQMLWLAAGLASLTVLATGARAEEPDALPTPDILGSPAPEATVSPSDAAPRRRSDLDRLLTADEQAQLRVAGEQARVAAETAKLAAKDVGVRLQGQAATLALLVDQLKPTPEEMARLRTIIDQQKALFNDQAQTALQRQLDELQRQLKTLRRDRED